MSAPVDDALRKAALDPARSFIVQAPAGSGKTELLTRRVLTLLTTVDEPEEILAITFTRKAASEMRERVVESLQRARLGELPTNSYEEEGYVLASQVLQRDAERGWQLLRNPQRLNLRTIDALATQLAHRLPVVSALGAPVGVIEDASGLYKDVAARFIDEHMVELDLLLLQLGNKLEKAQTLLANLLANRDQWKRYVYGREDDDDSLRAMLESMLEALVESRLEALCAAKPVGFGDEIPGLLRVAAHYIAALTDVRLENLSSVVQPWVEMQSMPGSQADDLPLWRGVAEAALTKSGTLRKSLTRASGFPTNKADAQATGASVDELKTHKRRMNEALEPLLDEPDFLTLLNEARELPDPRYGDQQWALLAQLLKVLPSLLLELQLVFQERCVVDFVELSERAQRAMGTEDSPTDLTLAMDLRLRHVLVDEFQDTSLTQFGLFAKLVSGWEQNDGRTFFAVGDPMQSIYRFRDGDVALFARAREQGIAGIKLDSLVLSVNFRAAPPVIDWVNETFARIFPDEVDLDSGAVPYAASVAHLDTEGGVEVHAMVDVEAADEAAAVARLATEAIAGNAKHSVAILVRSRPQAIPIFEALRAAGVQYRSIDMDLLGERPVVQDLLSLCLALRYPHDRLHWLSLLRSPGCGLTLTDLNKLMNGCKTAAVIDLLRDPQRQAVLTEDGQTRVQRLLSVIEPAVKRAPRSALLPWVEACWLQLGGPAACRDAVDLDAAERCLVRLQVLEAAGELWQKSVLGTAMHTLYAAAADTAGIQVQVMTLHKAKGLEFDTVILPALDRKPRSDTAQLLNWFEGTLDGQSQLLLAPMEEQAATSKDPIYRLVRNARERADAQERLRLLYVACTRAKHHLHLLARAKVKQSGDDLSTPHPQSLLKPLWPLLEPRFLATHKAAVEISDTHEPSAAASDAVSDDAISDTHKSRAGLGESDTHKKTAKPLDDSGNDTPTPLFERVVAGWRAPELPHFAWPTGSEQPASHLPDVEFAWASSEARDIGTVVHRQLQRLAGLPADRAAAATGELAPIVTRQLQNMGVSKLRLEVATERVMKALTQTLAAERGRWILDESHAEARSEWALTVPGFMGVQRVVIDRTFVDAEGTRWIVDFKTGDHAGGQVEAFLDSEQERYRAQLDGYADIMRRIEKRPIRVGLWFPMLQGWREWVPAEANTEPAV
ncbi:MAG: UvrD-helicase domain-containing protein [Granulosicoccus sp.]